MKIRAGVVVLTLLLVAAAATQPATQPARAADSGNAPTVQAIAHSYKTLQLITPKPVYVNPELAMLCAGATHAEVVEAAKKHGVHANAQISVYLNDLAADAFTKSAKSYPVGAVVVKEKQFLGYRRTDAASDWAGEGHGVGGMIKRAPGFDRDHGDWEYFYFEDASKILRGRIASCVKCHAGAAASDHVFGTWARAKDTE